ncbi:MAG: hypothetical protein HQ567_18045 [Candidatus Nealsonbacteria bacterium]|nr:hypothetical protein [Candidatus Nealsonbacteria bacterium]
MSDEVRDILILLGICLPIGLVAGMLTRRKYPAGARAYGEYSQTVRWPIFALGAAFFLFCAAARRDHAGFFAAFVFFGAMQVVAMLFAIWRHRSQWSIRMLLALTLLVAVSCSLFRWWGWPILPVFVVATCVAGLIGMTTELIRWRREKGHD